MWKMYKDQKVYSVDKISLRHLAKQRHLRNFVTCRYRQSSLCITQTVKKTTKKELKRIGKWL